METSASGSSTRKGAKHVAYEGIAAPNGIQLSPGQSFLMVDDYTGRGVWSFQIQPDGSLTNGDPFYRLETPDESSATDADGMTMDTEGWLYVTTNTGLQVFDPQGKLVAILNKPQAAPISNVVFGGPNRDTLYLTGGDKVYKRPMTRKGTRELGDRQAGATLARMFHKEPAARRDKPASTALRSLAVLTVLFKYASARQASRALYPRASDASRFDSL